MWNETWNCKDRCLVSDGTGRFPRDYRTRGTEANHLYPDDIGFGRGIDYVFRIYQMSALRPASGPGRDEC